MPAFVDTNVVIYAAVDDQKAPAKRQIALGILTRHDLVVSYQVLVEFYHQATRANRMNALTHRQASDVSKALTRYPVVEGTLDLFRAGLELRRTTNYSMWDCMIIAAAQAGGCDTLLSEDMNHGRTMNGVAIVNPFADAV